MKNNKKRIRKKSTKEILDLMQKEIDENELKIELPTID
jgi:hypothetical protein